MGFEFEKDKVTHIYEDIFKIYRDNINVITTAREEGTEEGMEKGATENAIKLAENFLNMGLSVEQVAKGSELPIEKNNRNKK